jgi:hypothetical protein
MAIEAVDRFALLVFREVLRVVWKLANELRV